MVYPQIAGDNQKSKRNNNRRLTVASIEKKIDAMHIQNGLEPIADFIYQSSDSQRSGVLS